MSRIGVKPVPIPSGVAITVKDGSVRVKGPKGELDAPLGPRVRARGRRREEDRDGEAARRRARRTARATASTAR